MNALRTLSLVPFVPSGSDYDASRRFFADLGFEEAWEHDGYAEFRNGDVRFLLQRFDNEAFASNLMIKIVVGDLDAWWQAVSEKQLETRYARVRLRPPTSFPWGREVHVVDPAGVCWHVADR